MDSKKKSEVNALWKVWEDHDSIKIPGTQYTLKGFSIAALRTNFYIPELSVMLDAGLSANLAPEHIFLTHTHADHCANLPYHLYSAKEGQKIQIYVPEDLAKKVDNMLDGIVNLNGDFPNPEFDSKASDNVKCYDIIPVKPSIFMLTLKNKKFQIEVIKCYHGIPCVGYGFSEIRSKLKDEYSKLSGKEIRELKKSGVEILHDVIIPIFCFVGDTSDQVLADNTLDKYQNIMIECTFIHDNEIEQANKTHHIHWKSLEPYITSHPNITFILYHFSQRYKKSEIAEFFSKLALSNVVPWIN